MIQLTDQRRGHVRPRRALENELYTRAQTFLNHRLSLRRMRDMVIGGNDEIVIAVWRGNEAPAARPAGSHGGSVARRPGPVAERTIASHVK